MSVHCVITESTTITIVTGAGAWVFSKDGKLIRIVWEKQPSWAKQQMAVIEAATTLLETTSNLQDTEELRTQAVKTLAAATQAIARKTAATQAAHAG
jgi:hypothetical protein